MSIMLLINNSLSSKSPIIISHRKTRKSSLSSIKTSKPIQSQIIHIYSMPKTLNMHNSNDSLPPIRPGLKAVPPSPIHVRPPRFHKSISPMKFPLRNKAPAVPKPKKMSQLDRLREENNKIREQLKQMSKSLSTFICKETTSSNNILLLIILNIVC